MKSFLRRPLGFFILFALIVVAGDRLLAMTIGRLIDQSQFRFSRLYRGDAVAEIVAFGDSRCVHSFYAPGLSEALNRKVVNLGYNGFSMEMIECLITDYLEHSSPPKLIILEVTNVFRAPDALINLKPFLTHSPLLTNLYRRERPDDYFYTQLSHLYRLNCELTLRVLYYSARDDQGWILTRPMSAALVEPKGATTAEAEHEDMPYLEKNLAALDRILDLTQKKGVEVRLIVAPYWPDYYQQSTTKRATIKQVAERLRLAGRNSENSVIWDYASLLVQPEYFADRIHTNLAGAIKLQQRLQADGFFQAGSLPPATDNP